MGTLIQSTNNYVAIYGHNGHSSHDKYKLRMLCCKKEMKNKPQQKQNGQLSAPIPG